jgi:hypothetical protein
MGLPFALALESADLAVEAFENAKNLEEARKNLASAMTQNATRLVNVANVLKYQFSIKFGGMDFSLAPFPEEGRSLGTAFERLGVPRVGAARFAGGGGLHHRSHGSRRIPAGRVQRPDDAGPRIGLTQDTSERTVL